LPRAKGVERIHLPGERGDAIRAEREAAGIPIPKGTWQRIGKTAQALGVKPPV
jgi:LDH2 family malate/lactate/ureidoglycolate dehydrogenase